MPKRVPWYQFRVGSPAEKENSRLPLSEIYHVAHLESAHRIVVDGTIRSGLIFDKSKLNKERIQVAWLSPNHWHHGYRYGSVSFIFDWKTLVAGRRAYWVESIAYGVEACRILLTKKTYDEHHALTLYEPTIGNGPWWFDKKSRTH